MKRTRFYTTRTGHRLVAIWHDSNQGALIWRDWQRLSHGVELDVVEKDVA